MSSSSAAAKEPLEEPQENKDTTDNSGSCSASVKGSPTNYQEVRGVCDNEHGTLPVYVVAYPEEAKGIRVGAWVRVTLRFPNAVG